MNRYMRADFLLAQPGAISGMGRALDLGGTFDDYNQSSSEREADLRASYVDWQIVGNDLRSAINMAKSELKRPLTAAPAQLELALRVG